MLLNHDTCMSCTREKKNQETFHEIAYVNWPVCHKIYFMKTMKTEKNI